MKITVLYSLPHNFAASGKYRTTDDDTRDSALEVSGALSSRGHDCLMLPLSPDRINRVSSIRTDLVFNLVEWTGRDLKYSLQTISLLEKTGIPFTGVGAKVFEETSDRTLMKRVLNRLKAPTPGFWFFKTGTEKTGRVLKYPLIVKLAAEHCSIGLSKDNIVEDRQALITKVTAMIGEFDQPVVAEEFIDGREFQVTVVDGATGPDMLPPAEIIFNGQERKILTYESRWDENHEDYNTSRVAIADLTPAELSSLRRLVVSVFRNFPLTDYARFDIRLRNGIFYILEANSNPGLGCDEEYGMTYSQQAAGLSFADFIDLIVKSACRRYGKNC